MDDMLPSNPWAFRALPVFWKRSFIKMDDDENQAFKDALLRLNHKNLQGSSTADDIFPSDWQNNHARILSRLQGGEYHLSARPFLAACAEKIHLKHEMALEIGLLELLVNKDPETCNVFGVWDYLHHQVVASPFKPVDYMDRMDVFGYSFIQGYKPTKANFLVVELKKGSSSETADIEQLMNYVDWIKDEYSFGDYSMIRAFLVAHEFTEELTQKKAEIASRRYIVGRRPAVSQEWNDLTLVQYGYDSRGQRLKFSIV